MPKSPTVSIVIPVYNEEQTIVPLIARLRQVLQGWSYELIVVDDASTDRTAHLLERLSPVIDQILTHRENRGKGAALQTGWQRVRGEVSIVQDADLEYDPIDIPNVVAPILEGHADVVYGSRFKGNQPHRLVYFWHYVANVVLTLMVSVLTNLNLSDMETGYKAVRTDLLKSLELTESGFSIEPEITIKLTQRKPRFYEVGISYYGRTYEEGKKITFWDAVHAVWVIVKYGILARLQPGRGNSSS